MKQTLHIAAEPLRLNLKTTIHHAAAKRNKGESIWVQATRNGECGYGEGCPRIYVAGDDLDASLIWIKKNFSSGLENFKTMEDLHQWAKKIKKKSIPTHRRGAP